jgi:hypothetical protein
LKAFLTLTNCNNTYFLIWVVVLVFNGTFKNISVILWRSVVFVERPGVHEENNRPAHMHDHKGPFSHLYLLCVMCYLKFVCLLWNIALCDSIWPCRWIYLVLVKYIHLSCFNVFGEWVNEWVTLLFQSQLNNFSALSWRE